MPNYQRVSGTAAGTTTLLTSKGNFHRMITPLVKTGTATFYDNASGTSAATHIVEVSNAIAGTVPQYEMGFRVKDGLTVVIGGTTDFVVVYD